MTEPEREPLQNEAELKTADEAQSDVKTPGFDSKSAEIWLKRSLFFSTDWFNKNIKHSMATSNS